MQSLPANAASTSGVSTSVATGNAISSGSMATANSPSTTTQGTSNASGTPTSHAAPATTSTTSTQASQDKTTLWSRVVRGWQVFAQGFTILGVLVAILWGIWTWWLAYKADARADWTSEQLLKQSCINDRVGNIELQLKTATLTIYTQGIESPNHARMRNSVIKADGALQARFEKWTDPSSDLHTEAGHSGFISWILPPIPLTCVFALTTGLWYSVHSFTSQWSD